MLSMKTSLPMPGVSRKQLRTHAHEKHVHCGSARLRRMTKLTNVGQGHRQLGAGACLLIQHAQCEPDFHACFYRSCCTPRASMDRCKFMPEMSEWR